MTKTITSTLAVCLAGAALVGFGLTRPPASDAAPLAEGGYAADPNDGYVADDGYSSDDGYGSDREADSASSNPGIVIVNFDFEGTLTVSPGDTVIVTNQDTAPHTVTSNDGLFDSGTLAQGESASIVVPSDPGEYSFFCSVHPSMTGVLVVQAS